MSAFGGNASKRGKKAHKPATSEIRVLVYVYPERIQLTSARSSSSSDAYKRPRAVRGGPYFSGCHGARQPCHW
jgi:hypothetical protein